MPVSSSSEPPPGSSTAFRSPLCSAGPMEFFFVDPGPLIDHELELVAPGPRHVEDLLASCRHPLCANDRAASTTTRERVHEFLKRAPGGHERPDSDRGTVPAYHFWMRLHAFGG